MLNVLKTQKPGECEKQMDTIHDFNYSGVVVRCSYKESCNKDDYRQYKTRH